MTEPFHENCSRRLEEADSSPTLPPRYLGGYEILPALAVDQKALTAV